MLHMTQSLHCAAGNQPKHLFSTDGKNSQTWAQTRDRVARLAAGLRAKGIREGDRVAILALNSAAYLEAQYAAWWIGAVIVPMNIRWSPAENAYSLKDAGAKALFVDDMFGAQLPTIRGEGADPEVIITLGKEHDGVAFEALIADNAPCDDIIAGGETLAGLYYTGGTTGFPKGVMLPHRALWFNGLEVGRIAGVRDDEVYLHAAPMFHMLDATMGNAVNAVGGTHVTIPAFDPGAFLNAIEAHNVTMAAGVPAMIAMVLQHPDFSAERTRSLRTFGYGGAPMPEGILRAAVQAMPQAGFYQAYGQTELAPLATMLTAKWHALDGEYSTKLRSAGRPGASCEVRIVDPDGNDLPTGDIGEVAVRSPGTMLGYWERPEETAAAFKDGWVFTGDGGYLDDDGFLFIVDRIKDMIVTGGENVYSAEVESAISTIDGVAQVAVIGIPSEKWGEAVHAIIVPGEGVELTEEGVIAHCKERIAGYKCPRSVEIRSEPMPLTGAGKILKRALRETYWKDQDRQVG